MTMQLDGAPGATFDLTGLRLGEPIDLAEHVASMGDYYSPALKATLAEAATKPSASYVVTTTGITRLQNVAPPLKAAAGNRAARRAARARARHRR